MSHHRAGAARPEVALASSASPEFARTLERLGVSVVLVSEQAGVLVWVRARDGLVNTDSHALAGEPADGATDVAERDGVITHATEWRGDDGVLVDHATSDVVVSGLSRPHSPRWNGEQLWLLEGGTGSLCRVDAEAGVVERVVELPGYTRGMAFAGDVAFIGLSQLREPGEAARLPLGRRLNERQSGIWAVDLRTASVVGWLRFDDAVQEVDSVAVVPGA